MPHRLRSGTVPDDERLLAAAVWAADVGAYEWDIGADTVRWLNDWCQRNDVDPCDGPRHGEQWRERVHPDDRAHARREYDLHIAGERDRYEAEYRIRTLSGGWRWIRNRGYVANGVPGGRQRRLMGICVDVDERKRTEAALDRSRRSLAALAATAPVWMLLIDADGRIEFLNRAVSLRGIDPAAAIGKPVTALAANAAEARQIELLHRQVVRSGMPQTASLLVEDGRTIAIWANPILEEGGAVASVAAVVLDVSERRNRERELLAAVAAEQRRFAHDLHDGLGQELTGIALLLKTLAKKIEREAPSLAPSVGEVLDYVNGAIATSREVARGVSPVGREHGGLAQALADLAGRLDRPGGPKVACRVQGGDLGELEPLLAENLFRIAQEAVTNALRHSGAGRITIELARSPGGVRLMVEDDGCGIGAGGADHAGLGLRIMRSRAELVGAELTLSTLEPRGTRVECLRDLPGLSAAAASRAG